MKSKTIYKIVSLVMALAMILGNTIQTQAALPDAAIVSPSIYWGAMVQGKVPSSTNLQGVFNTFETRSQKKMSIIHWGESWILSDGTWGEFQTGYFDNVRNRGSIPMLNWDSQKLGAGINQANFQLRDVYGGTYDSYITRWATDARNWGHPFFLYFDPEMNGWWSPWAEGKLSNGTIVNGNSAGDYVKAWRHVHDIFTSVGATNVTWVWAPNHMSTSSQYPVLSTLYPGDAYVDWTGLSVYNKYPTWAGLNPLLTGSEGMTWFRNSYKDVLALAPNKPMMLAQWASIEAGDGGAKKAAWITDALTVQIPTNFPKIKAIVWFNWQETPDETYPIETSQAATNAWAAGIASPRYAVNQFGNLNTSPIPPLVAVGNISGNVGVAGAIMRYTDGTAKTVTSLADGSYSLSVKGGWSGTVTPYKPGYLFTPYTRSYSNIQSDQTGQNYAVQLCSECADLNVLINTDAVGNYTIASQPSLKMNYPSTLDGPVKVVSTNGKAIVASQRVVYRNSFNELMGYPADKFVKEYWFPWYDGVYMKTWILVGNPSSSQTAYVDIYIGGVKKNVMPYAIVPSGNITSKFDGLVDGPVRVVSVTGNGTPTPLKIFASERSTYLSSFNEVMGMPFDQFTTEYWFPWYDSMYMKTWILVGNPSSSQTAYVDIYIGGVKQGDTRGIAPNGNVTPLFQGVLNGPVRVVSVPGDGTPTPLNIFTSERSISGNSFSEVMGVPFDQFTTEYWFPWIDRSNSNGMKTWILVGNPSSGQTAYVDIYIGGVKQGDTRGIPPSGNITPTFPISNGPLRVVSVSGDGTPSPLKIFTSERILYGSSFNEMMGYPADELATEYWFTWYDSIYMSSDLLIAKP